MHPERVIKLICDDIIIAQPQGGALCYHKFAIAIEPENTPCIIYLKHTDMIIHLFKQ